MFFLAATLGGDFVYRKVAAKNIFLYFDMFVFYDWPFPTCTLRSM